MDKLITPQVITAIADPEFEGLVSTALFSQGWNVIARTLDMASLEEATRANPGQLIVVYSVDLPGISQKRIESLSSNSMTLFGFADSTGGTNGINEISQRPNSTAEFLAFIRGNIRSPRVRSPLIQQSRSLRAKIIGVGSAGYVTGNTVLTLNLAQEAAQMGKSTLLIDANFQSPAIATLLDLRKVSTESKWRDVSENFAVSEVTQEKIPEFQNWVTDAATFFDVIFIDLGSLSNFTSTLTDRRWSSQVKIWTSNMAKSLVLTSTSDLLPQKRLKDLAADMSRTSLTTEIYLAMLDTKKGNKKEVITASGLCAPSRIWQIPNDARACSLAEHERTTLAQVSAKSQLRKAILNFSTEITG
jgi:hypothetical protein